MKITDRPEYAGCTYTGEFIARDYIQKSTDPVPYEGIAPGSMLIYSDTGKQFVFTASLEWVPVSSESELPEVTVEDDGKFLGVENGAWGKVIAPEGANPSIIGSSPAMTLADLDGVAVGWKDENGVIHKIPSEYAESSGGADPKIIGTGDEVLADETLDVDSSRGANFTTPFPLVIGKAYNVTLDDVDYPNLICFDDGGYETIGSPSGQITAELPFTIYVEGDATILLMDEYKSVTVKVVLSNPEKHFSDLSEVALGWKEEGEEVLCDDDYVFTTMQGSPVPLVVSMLDAPLDVVENDKVLVTVDDETVEYTVISMPYDSVYFGDKVTASFAYQAGEGMVMFGSTTFEDGSTHHIKVTKVYRTFHKIPTEYVEGAMWVRFTIDPDTNHITADKSVGEIIEASSRVPVFGYDGEYIYNLVEAFKFGWIAEFSACVVKPGEHDPTLLYVHGQYKNQSQWFYSEYSEGGGAMMVEFELDQWGQPYTSTTIAEIKAAVDDGRDVIGTLDFGDQIARARLTTVDDEHATFVRVNYGGTDVTIDSLIVTESGTTFHQTTIGG